ARWPRGWRGPELAAVEEARLWRRLRGRGGKHRRAGRRGAGHGASPDPAEEEDEAEHDAQDRGEQQEPGGEGEGEGGLEQGPKDPQHDGRGAEAGGGGDDGAGRGDSVEAIAPAIGLPGLVESTLGHFLLSQTTAGTLFYFCRGNLRTIKRLGLLMRCSSSRELYALEWSAVSTFFCG
ncbi:unnamed protein product, partial [Scytosiphon promiscuus]